MKKISLLLLCLMFTMVFSGCQHGGSKEGAATTTQKIKIIATVYPVYEFAKQVGGDWVDIELLVPPGAEPHDWEPKAKDLAKIKSAKLFLYHGAGLESWTNKLLTKEVLGNVTPVEAAQGIELMEAAEPGEKHHEHEFDPHVWLDPVLAQQEVDNIMNALIQADPDHTNDYRENTQKYKAELAELDREYRETLTKVPRHDIITTHNAFGYLTKRYYLEQQSMMGLSPDAEPTPEKMAQVVQFCQAHDVKYIFFETLVSPKLAQTIAQETGAQALVLNPIEGLTVEEKEQGKNYISLMRENLVNLKKSLSE